MVKNTKKKLKLSKKKPVKKIVEQLFWHEEKPHSAGSGLNNILYEVNLELLENLMIRKDFLNLGLPPDIEQSILNQLNLKIVEAREKARLYPLGKLI